MGRISGEARSTNVSRSTRTADNLTPPRAAAAASNADVHRVPGVSVCRVASRLPGLRHSVPSAQGHGHVARAPRREGVRVRDRGQRFAFARKVATTKRRGSGTLVRGLETRVGTHERASIASSGARERRGARRRDHPGRFRDAVPRTGIGSARVVVPSLHAGARRRRRGEATRRRHRERV